MPLKALDDLRAMAAADDVAEDDTPGSSMTLALKPDTMLAKAMLEVARSIEDFKLPEDKDAPDYGPQLEAIAQGFGRMQMVAAAVASLREDLAGLTKAIGAMKVVDMGGVADALNAVASAQRDLARAMTAPREIKLAENGLSGSMSLERQN